MVVKEDGTKWACQSCLKGHRVSGCTHTDRELTLVPKKGRPVTQCQHCRQERKKRSAHHKCDCGETEKPHHPKEKCIHLREAEERAKAGFHDDHPHPEKDAAHLAAVAEEQGCCCPHGGKCTCSTYKKESNPSSDGVAPHGPAVQKPRLEPTRSDGSITVFANGHHKPVHRKNHAAHECGMPYKMPMTRAHTEQNITTARRSVDNLALDSNMSFSQSNFILPGQYPTQRRKSKSEQHSPKLSATVPYSTSADTKLSLDFATLGPVRTNRSIDSATSDTAMFPPFVDPMSGIAESSYDPWSALPPGDTGIFPNNNPFGPWATHYDGSSVGQPALTAPSSGTQSEIDEIPPMDDLYGFSMPSIQEDMDGANADATIVDGGNPNRRSLPPNFFGNTDFSLPMMDGEWQTPIAGIRGSEDAKMKQSGSDQGFDTWQTPTMHSMSGLQHRATAMASIPGRPQSHSIGPGNVPSDDVIKQLFPDIDVSGGPFGAVNSPQIMDSPALKRLVGLPSGSASAPMDFTTPDENISYSARPWDDGSISVPADAFNSPYNLDQDFSNEWSAQ